MPQLQYFPLATQSMEEALENSLASLIAAHRSDKGMATHWDSEVHFCVVFPVVWGALPIEVLWSLPAC